MHQAPTTAANWQNGMEVVTVCPACNEAGNLVELPEKVRDLSLTGEEFSLSRCTSCGLALTTPRPQEAKIGKYYDNPNYISHSDEAPGFMNTIYRLARRWMTSRKLAYMRTLVAKPHGNLLDYGCGAGYFIAEAKNAGWNVTGIEVNDTARRVAIGRVGENVVQDVNSLNPAQRFDVITLWHVLEHIHQLDTTVTALINHLAQGGRMLVAVPNPESLDAKKYGSCWAAYDVPRHLYHFTRKSIHVLMERLGCEVVRESGQPLDAFYISLLSEQYQKGSKLNAVLSGMQSNLRAGKTGDYSSIVYEIKRKQD